MSLYAIGDLHLHFQASLKASNQLYDPVWKGHESLFRRNCARLITPRDTLVLLGDHSWGRTLAECEQDLEYICALPGQKILLRGNHDMFWDAKKTEMLNQKYAGRLFFLQNNFATYGEYALIGTKGYTFEGPFYLRGGRIIGWDTEAAERAEKLVEREAGRRIPEVHHVPALSAYEYPGREKRVYRYGKGVWCGAGYICALSWYAAFS